MKLVSVNAPLLLVSLSLNVFFVGYLFLKDDAFNSGSDHPHNQVQDQTTHLSTDDSKTQVGASQMLANRSPSATGKDLASQQTLSTETEATRKPTDNPPSLTTDNTTENDWILQAVKENPEALQAIQAEQNMRVQIEYNSFLKQNTLSPSLQSALIKALIARETVPYELNHQDEELIQNQYEQYQQQIDNLLGPQLSQELREYEQMMDSRWTMQDVKQLLDVNNNTFTVKKERQLAQIIAHARSHVYAEYKSSGAFDTQGQTEVDNSLPLNAIHQEILAQASQLLTPDELMALDQALQHEALQSKSSDIITSILLKQGPQ